MRTRKNYDLGHFSSCATYVRIQVITKLCYDVALFHCMTFTRNICFGSCSKYTLKKEMMTWFYPPKKDQQFMISKVKKFSIQCLSCNMQVPLKKKVLSRLLWRLQDSISPRTMRNPVKNFFFEKYDSNHSITDFLKSPCFYYYFFKRYHAI